MRTYSSKTIGSCLCTLAFAVTGALCALLSAGLCAHVGWDFSGADSLSKLGFVVGLLFAFGLLANAASRIVRHIRISVLKRGRSRS